MDGFIGLATRNERLGFGIDRAQNDLLCVKRNVKLYTVFTVHWD